MRDTTPRHGTASPGTANPGTAGGDRPRFLSEADCHDITSRLARFANGGGYTVVKLVSTWTGNVRWARNRITVAGEVRDNVIEVVRNLNGAEGQVVLNDTTDAALVAAVRQAERIAQLGPELPNSDLVTRLPLEPRETPSLFSNATYQLDARHRTETGIALARAAANAGMLSAGYIEVMARSLAVLDTLGRAMYFPYTQAQYSVTVRDPKGTGSGWAGADHYDWSKIDAEHLTAVALDKCLKSQSPVRVEPGRYTTILEPQAVGDFVGCLLGPPDLMSNPVGFTDNLYSGGFGKGPFNKSTTPPGMTLLGERVVDERITISADPMDAELGFPPFSLEYAPSPDRFVLSVYHKTTWIERGVLTALAYDRDQAIAQGRSLGRPNSGAFRMTGGNTSVEEMIATTTRGILVTRFDQLERLDYTSQLYRGYTRDGLWLIEHGKISKSIKNLVFTESILFALNNVEQMGVPQRVFHAGIPDPFWPPQPRFVPALKIRDFSFTSLTDAV